MEDKTKKMILGYVANENLQNKLRNAGEDFPFRCVKVSTWRVKWFLKEESFRVLESLRKGGGKGRV